MTTTAKKLKEASIFGRKAMRNLVQFSRSAVSSLSHPMDWSTPGFPVYHQSPEPTQIHVHCVSDAMQLSHPLSFPSPPAFNLFQHQGLFQ